MVKKLKEEFEKIYFVEISTTKGILALAQEIKISKNTLRRFLGKENCKSQLTTNSLNLLSKYLGYDDYNNFKTKDQNKLTIDFKTLKTFYDTVKGEGIIINENRFQNVNYQYAKQIIENQTNLKYFFIHFHDNKEALEYVLGWHPTYGKISQNEYHNLLFKFENKLKLSHIKVFVNSFIFFGKFISNSLVESDFYLIKKAEKEVVKMRKEYDFFWAFPEVRFAIARTLYLFYTKNPELENYIDQVININKNNAALHDKILFDFYYADALNLIGKYKESDILQTNHKTIEKINSSNYYHAQTQLPFFKASRAITCIKIKNFQEAKKLFDELTKLNFSKLSFDIKDYIEIQYYIVAYLLYPENSIFQKKITEINSKIGFHYLHNYL